MENFWGVDNLWSIGNLGLCASNDAVSRKIHGKFTNYTNNQELAGPDGKCYSAQLFSWMFFEQTFIQFYSIENAFVPF